MDRIINEYPTITVSEKALFMFGRNMVLKGQGVYLLLGNTKIGTFQSNLVTGELFIELEEIAPGKYVAGTKHDDLTVWRTVTDVKGKTIKHKVGSVYKFDPDYMTLSQENSWKKRTGQAVKKSKYGNVSGYGPGLKNGWTPEEERI